MIRTEPDKSSSSWLHAVMGVFLLAAFLAAVSVALIMWQSLSPSASILLGGVGLVALLGILGLFIVRRNLKLNDRRGTSRGQVYSDAFYFSPTPGLIVQNGHPVHANAAYFELARSIGLESEAGSPPSVDRLFSHSSQETASAIFRLHHMQSEMDFAEETIDVILNQSDFRRFNLSIQALKDQDGSYLWHISDVTNAENAEAAMMSSAPVGLFSVSKDGKVLAINEALERWLGGDLTTRPTHMREFIESPDTLLDSTAEPGRVVRTETRLMTRKGVVTPSIMVGTWQELANGDLIANVALHGHSSVRKEPPIELTAAQASRAEAGLGSKSLTAETGPQGGVSAAPVAMLELKGSPLSEAIVTAANPAFTRMSGGLDWQDGKFASVFEDIQSEHRFLEMLPEQCSADKPYDATLKNMAGEGLPVSVYIVSDLEQSDHVFAYMVDVSARKSLEAQLVQSQKMQAIGQLAAGVAHDFNNLLTAIRLNTDELLQRHPVGDPSYPELQNINATGARAAALVKKLLAFSRKQTRRMERLNVTEVLSDMSITLKQTLGEKAKLSMDHARDLPQVVADKSQIDTVLMNLCVNARDAMLDQGGGNITVKTSLLPRSNIDEPGLTEALSTLPGDDFVIISVMDNGTGMSDEVKAKIFEPFFTTKEQGKGTGLGLATVYGIVQQTGGYLDVQSELGQGTTFRIFLPAIDPNTKIDIPEAKPPKPMLRKPADMAGQGNILFVEDEASVRIIAAKSLRKRGYNVVEAEDGDEALELLEEAEEPFDLMISDVVMPGIDGPTLLKQGRSLLGDARIVFISGYAEEEFSDLLSEEPDVTFLPKPFTLEQLAEKVKAEIGDAK